MFLEYVKELQRVSKIGLLKHHVMVSLRSRAELLLNTLQFTTKSI